jgi:hypothetical protein
MSNVLLSNLSQSNRKFLSTNGTIQKSVYRRSPTLKIVYTIPMKKTLRLLPIPFFREKKNWYNLPVFLFTQQVWKKVLTVLRPFKTDPFSKDPV